MATEVNSLDLMRAAMTESEYKEMMTAISGLASMQAKATKKRSSEEADWVTLENEIFPGGEIWLEKKASTQDKMETQEHRTWQLLLLISNIWQTTGSCKPQAAFEVVAQAMGFTVEGNKISEVKPTTRAERQHYTSAEVNGQTVVEFGKNKGKMAIEVRMDDQPYVKWLLEREVKIRENTGHPQALPMLEYMMKYYALERPKGAANYLRDLPGPTEVVTVPTRAKGAAKGYAPATTRVDIGVMAGEDPTMTVMPTTKEISQAMATFQQILAANPTSSSSSK